MKKVFRFFLLFAVLFVGNGCSLDSTVSNINDFTLIEVNDSNDALYNLEKGLMGIKAFSFDVTVKVKDEEYLLKGKVIRGKTLKDSVINISYNKNNLYLRNGKVYLSYYHNNTNVVVRDKLDNFIKEIVVFLNSKDIKCNEQDVLSFINNSFLGDINLSSIEKYIICKDSDCSIIYNDFNVSLNEKFLPDQVKYENKNVIVSFNFEYDKVNIKIPLIYDWFFIDLKDIKKLFKVGNIFDLIR